MRTEGTGLAERTGAEAARRTQKQEAEVLCRGTCWQKPRRISVGSALLSSPSPRSQSTAPGTRRQAGLVGLPLLVLSLVSPTAIKTMNSSLPPYDYSNLAFKVSLSQTLA